MLNTKWQAIHFKEQHITYGKVLPVDFNQDDSIFWAWYVCVQGIL